MEKRNSHAGVVLITAGPAVDRIFHPTCNLVVLICSVFTGAHPLPLRLCLSFFLNVLDFDVRRAAVQADAHLLRSAI